MNKHKKDIIAWWSGGIASAVTCYLCIELFDTDIAYNAIYNTNSTGYMGAQYCGD